MMYSPSHIRISKHFSWKYICPGLKLNPISLSFGIQIPLQETKVKQNKTKQKKHTVKTSSKQEVAWKPLGPPSWALT